MDTAIAALLHDAPEDQGGFAKLAPIKARFGDHVAQIVRGCPDTFEKKNPAWCKRKEDYLAHLGQADGATCLVSVADKLQHAIEEIGNHKGAKHFAAVPNTDSITSRVLGARSQSDIEVRGARARSTENRSSTR